MRLVPVGAVRPLLVWAITRTVVLVLLATQEQNVVGDVNYYRVSLDQLSHLHVAGTLVEYPVPAVILLWIPYAALGALGRLGAYTAAIAALAVLTDLGFLAAIVQSRRWARRRRFAGITAAEWAWLAAVPALGATAYARFDLVPGILVGLALLYIVHRPGLAAGFGALATGVKYWPALVVPALSAPRRGRRAVIVTVSGVGLVIGLASLGLGGWHRLWTPLAYQNVRGLQIESVAATPAMLAWGHGTAGYAVTYTQWRAYDITGPIVGPLLHVATIASVVALVLVVSWWALAWWQLRGGPAADGEAETLVWLVLATVGAFIVTNKVLSPQYLLWLLPPAAAGLVVLRGRAARPLLGWTLGLLVAAALTHEIYPRQYGYLLGLFGGTEPIVYLLAARNLILLALVVYAAVRVSLLLLLRSRARVRTPLSDQVTAS